MSGAGSTDKDLKMIEIKGKYNTARIYTDNVEEEAQRQILRLVDQAFSSGSRIAVMPDAHAGAGACIGLTMTIKDSVVPNLTGVDIGCGMLVVKVDKSFPIDLKQMDRIWHNDIPSGMNHRRTPHRFADNVDLDNLVCPVNADKLKLSISSLGSGNHYGEVDVDDEGNHYIVIHSGSRHLGIEVCRFHQDRAIAYHRNGNPERLSTIERLKSEGRETEIEEALKNIKPSVPNELAYLEGSLMQDYLHDMRIAQDFAMWNREAMMDVIIEGLGIKRKHILDKFCTMHNYIDLDNMVLRKGAISLQKDEVAIIPMNMRDGALIVKGKGNPEWNCSGPHGAGRLMSRAKARETLSMKDFKSSMKGIYTTCVSASTIDESPMAYKPMDEIVANIQDTAEVVKVIKPIYNFKAGE